MVPLSYSAMQNPAEDVYYSYDSQATATGASNTHKAFFIEQFKNRYYQATEQKNAQKRTKLEMTKIERDSQQAKAKEPTQGFY